MAERFHRAARDGNLDILREASRKDCNKLDEDGMTPTAWASYHGNLQALRMIIGRGGNPDVCDYLGNTSLHHAARHGHMNCVSYLTSFGANIWALDNEHATPLDAAGAAEREEIVKFLDASAEEQIIRHKKLVEKQKIKAIEDAEKNFKRYQRLQEEARRHMEKQQKKLAHDREIMDITDTGQNEKPKGMKKLFNTIRGKKQDTVKSSGARMYSEHFGGSGTHRGRGGVQRVLNKKSSDQDFRVREQDQSGMRTVRSMPGLRRDNQIMYVKGQNRLNGVNGDQNGDNSSHLSYTHSESEVAKLNGDSGIVSDGDDSEPGLFNRPKFGNLTFLNRPMTAHMMELTADQKGQDEVDEGTADNGHGVNGESDSIGSVGTLAHRLEKLPWSEEDLETLDDEEEETEFSALELFLAAHNLTEFLPTFTKEKVDFEALLLVTEEDLIQMGLPLGPRRKIKDALERRKDLATTPGEMFDTHL